jgi:formylglycine-generating enzyme
VPTSTAHINAGAMPADLPIASLPTDPRAAEPPTTNSTGACPDEMALVADGDVHVCVDKYEAALEGVAYSQPVEGAGILRAKPARGIKPQVNISEVEAEMACAGSGKRLCTATEWTAACRGPHGFTYPYGNDYEPGTCNEGRRSPVADPSGRLDNPRLAEAPKGIEPGGTFERCVSAYGLFDMHGNVHEWVSTSPKASEPQFGEMLGGFFAEAKENGKGCSYRTTAHLRTYHDYSTGFRCCKDPALP